MEVTEWANKKAQRNCLNELWGKGHEEQILFNVEMTNRIDTDNRRLRKVVPSSKENKTTIIQAMDKLKLGVAMINETHKNCRLVAPSLETVAAYVGSNVAEDEEDAKRIEKADKAAEQLTNRKKRKVADKRVRRPLPPPAQLPPGPNILPGPIMQLSVLTRPQLNPVRPIGPCYNCWLMGHSRVNCPRPNRLTHPFCLHM